MAKLVDESALYMTGKGHRKSEDNVNPLFGVKFSRNYFPISYLNCKIPTIKLSPSLDNNFYKLKTFNWPYKEENRFYKADLQKIANLLQII